MKRGFKDSEKQMGQSSESHFFKFKSCDESDKNNFM
jgi:hypothetical protein